MLSRRIMAAPGTAGARAETAPEVGEGGTGAGPHASMLANISHSPLPFALHEFG